MIICFILALLILQGCVVKLSTFMRICPMGICGQFQRHIFLAKTCKVSVRAFVLPTPNSGTASVMPVRCNPSCFLKRLGKALQWFPQLLHALFQHKYLRAWLILVGAWFSHRCFVTLGWQGLLYTVNLMDITTPTMPWTTNTCYIMLHLTYVIWALDYDSSQATGMRSLIVYQFLIFSLKQGFREVQDLALGCWGQPVQTTCKGRTRKDFMFLSPELQSLLRSVEVTHDVWPDHAVLKASFHSPNQLPPRGGQHRPLFRGLNSLPMKCSGLHRLPIQQVHTLRCGLTLKPVLVMLCLFQCQAECWDVHKHNNLFSVR